MEPIRALHVVHTMNRGGMESRIMDMYRRQNREALQCDFYIESGEKGAFDEEILSLGGRVYYANGPHLFNVPRFTKFRKFLSNHKDYKLVYSYNQWAGWYLKQAKKFNIPLRNAGSMTSLQTKSLKNTVKNVVKRNVNKYANYRFAVSLKAAQWLFGDKAVANGEVSIWPNAIDTERYAFSDEKREKARTCLRLSESYVVMHVGNIRFEKNHQFLIRVFEEIKKKHKNAKLVLAGGGSLERLKPMMDSLGVSEDVIHLGIRDDVPELLQAADAFVFPSLYEGFPGAVLEAEASGVKCLISDSITEEVLLTENIRAISLKRQPREWAEELDKITDVDRRTAWRIVKDAGFDVNDLVIKQEELIETVTR